MSVNILKTDERQLGLSRGELMKERKKGHLPAILFGKGMESVPLFIDQVEFQRVFKENGKIFEIEVGGKKHLINTKVYS
jgi:large subunit ribosomal protein L25